MTWSVQINGHSKAGPDNLETHEYLVEAFFNPIQEILNKISEDAKTQVTGAVLQTNAGSFDLVTGKTLSSAAS